MQFGHDPKLESFCKLRAQESRRVLQTIYRLGYDFRPTKRGEEYFRMVVIAAELDARQRDHADPWILDFGADQFSKIFLNLVRDPAKPRRIFSHLWGERKLRL